MPLLAKRSVMSKCLVLLAGRNKISARNHLETVSWLNLLNVTVKYLET